MASVRGMFKVVSREHYHNGQHVLAKLESTQRTDEMFAARIELMLTDAAAVDLLQNGAEVMVEFRSARKPEI